MLISITNVQLQLYTCYARLSAEREEGEKTRYGKVMECSSRAAVRSRSDGFLFLFFPRFFAFSFIFRDFLFRRCFHARTGANGEPQIASDTNLFAFCISKSEFSIYNKWLRLFSVTWWVYMQFFVMMHRILKITDAVNKTGKRKGNKYNLLCMYFCDNLLSGRMDLTENIWIILFLFILQGYQLWLLLYENGRNYNTDIFKCFISILKI